MSINGLIGKKISMTTHFEEDGSSNAATIVKLGPCVVTQVKTEPKDGYQAAQVGFMDVEKINKPKSGHLARSQGKFRFLREFLSVDLSDIEVGQEIKSDLFKLLIQSSIKNINKKIIQKSKNIKVKSNTSKNKFLSMVNKAKKYIKLGDIFQVVLSQRFEAKLTKKPLDIYKKLRVTNPSPFTFFFNFEDF